MGWHCRANGERIDDFIDESGSIVNSFTGRTSSVCTSPLRINHYVIKSLREFSEKKRLRGDVMQGIGHDPGMSYFYAHDFKDTEFRFPSEKLDKLKKLIDHYNTILAGSVFKKSLRGVIDCSDSNRVSGWLTDANGWSTGLGVNIFVNGIYNGFAACGFYRHDLKEAGISQDGLSEFRWTHSLTLSSGDVVEVKVHGNRYSFGTKSRICI